MSFADFIKNYKKSKGYNLLSLKDRISLMIAIKKEMHSGSFLNVYLLVLFNYEAIEYFKDEDYFDWYSTPSYPDDLPDELPNDILELPEEYTRPVFFLTNLYTEKSEEELIEIVSSLDN